MSAKVSIDDQLLKQLQQSGEMQVEDSHGVPLVLMTIHARQQLHKALYDDSEWTEEEMRAMGKDQLSDPEGWGAPGMEVYDTMEGDTMEGDTMEGDTMKGNDDNTNGRS